MTRLATRPWAELRELADGVFAYLQPHGGWCVNNAGVLAGPDGVVLVDTVATRRRAESLRTAVENLARGPVTTVVNTHHHGDHVFGNCVFTPGATVIGHELSRPEMIAAGFGLTGLWPDVDWGELTLEPPSVTFHDRLTLHLGERRVELLHVGPAHTTNDVVAWLPSERVLFAGDVLLPGCTPFVLMGSVHGSLAAVEKLRALRPETIVGGHGEIAGPEVFEATENYLRWVLQVAGEALSTGTSPLAAARESGFGAFGELLDPERLVANLHRARLELADPDRPLGSAIDVLGIFGELVEFNGGKPPSCLA